MKVVVEKPSHITGIVEKNLTFGISCIKTYEHDIDMINHCGKTLASFHD